MTEFAQYIGLMVIAFLLVVVLLNVLFIVRQHAKQIEKLEKRIKDSLKEEK